MAEASGGRATGARRVPRGARRQGRVPRAARGPHGERRRGGEGGGHRGAPAGQGRRCPAASQLPRRDGEVPREAGEVGHQSGSPRGGREDPRLPRGREGHPDPARVHAGATRRASAAASVRQEALIALRFLLGKKGTEAAVVKKVVAALVDAAEDPDRSLAQTALHTLAGMEHAGRGAEAAGEAGGAPRRGARALRAGDARAAGGSRGGAAARQACWRPRRTSGARRLPHRAWSSPSMGRPAGRRARRRCARRPSVPSRRRCSRPATPTAPGCCATCFDRARRRCRPPCASRCCRPPPSGSRRGTATGRRCSPRCATRTRARRPRRCASWRASSEGAIPTRP